MPTSKKRVPNTGSNKLFAVVICILAAVAVAGVLLFSFTRTQQGRMAVTDTLPVSRYEVLRFSPVNPYIVLRPTADGRYIDLISRNLVGVRRINLTFTYNAKGVDQGVVERIDLEKGATSSAKRIYLGSCSESTGIRRCYDHIGVSQGTVSAVLDKMQDEQNQEVRVEFRLLDLKKEEGNLASLDENVRVTITKGVVPARIIAAPLTGLPSPIPDATVIGQPYAVLAATDVALAGTVSFRLPPTVKTQSVTLFQWDETRSSWKPLPSTLADGVVSATIDRLGIYAATTTTPSP